ncbi:MAG TPA: GNAT family N-acetyltransferase [Bdellovibrionales bacterium]|nr:GNAT family N-acetyltransferase [Bdellovibrionales bacterium]
MEIYTRFLTNDDSMKLAELYRGIASRRGGFVRSEDEIDSTYIEKTIRGSERGGIAIGAFERSSENLVGAITARKPRPKAFDHVLSDLIIGVHPDRQSQGIGRRLFLDFIEHVQNNRTDISRVELMARDSNQRQIAFYEAVGFRREGFFEHRIRRPDGTFEGDVPMAWIKPE